MIGQSVGQMIASMERAVVGRRAEVEAMLVAFLAGGHVMLEGPPGTAKTLLVRALAATSGCSFRRIQFTPDLMPADVTGTHVYDPRDASFRLVRGPVFADIVLADEINRTPAKTQAALLECMEERTATIDGVTQSLPPIFTVFATMNPIEFEGTFPLPEAQLDRFMMKVPLGEVSLDHERELIARYVSGFHCWSLAEAGVAAVLDGPALLQLREAVGRVPVEESVQHYLVELVRRTRLHPAVALGASTRAAVALLQASRARAACTGRDYVLPDHIQFVAPFVLAHRLVLRPEAQLEQLDGSRVIAELLESVPVPRAVPA